MATKDKELLFSLTAKDFDWSYTKGTGSGGQKKNKTSSAVHCMHRASKAHGYAEDSRSQADNKQLAFKRLTETKEFKTWLHMETLRQTGKMKRIDDQVASEMRKVKVEHKVGGKWTDEKVVPFPEETKDE